MIQPECIQGNESAVAAQSVKLQPVLFQFEISADFCNGTETFQRPRLSDDPQETAENRNCPEVVSLNRHTAAAVQMKSPDCSVRHIRVEIHGKRGIPVLLSRFDLEIFKQGQQVCRRQTCAHLPRFRIKIIEIVHLQTPTAEMRFAAAERYRVVRIMQSGVEIVNANPLPAAGAIGDRRFKMRLPVFQIINLPAGFHLHRKRKIDIFTLPFRIERTDHIVADNRTGQLKFENSVRLRKRKIASRRFIIRGHSHFSLGGLQNHVRQDQPVFRVDHEPRRAVAERDVLIGEIPDHHTARQKIERFRTVIRIQISGNLNGIRGGRPADVTRQTRHEILVRFSESLNHIARRTGADHACGNIPCRRFAEEPARHAGTVGNEMPFRLAGDFNRTFSRISVEISGDRMRCRSPEFAVPSNRASNRSSSSRNCP